MSGSSPRGQSLRRRKREQDNSKPTIPKKQSVQRVKFVVATYPVVALSLLAIIVYTLIRYKSSTVDNTITIDSHAYPFEIKELPGRGKGLIATRDIEQGELLIKERPLVLVPSSTQESPSTLLRNRLNKLSSPEEISYFSLSYVVPGRDTEKAPLSEDDIILATFQTNAISAGSDVGLFPLTARLNHGCSSSFNSVYSWRPEEGSLVVHALKPIKRGEELLTTYTDTKRPRQERQNYLKSYYDFTCTCPVCSLQGLESQLSDKRLSEMTSLGQKFASWGSYQIDGNTASHIANTIWGLGEEEGYWSERGRLAADMVHVAAVHSDDHAVLHWAKLAHKWFSFELGNDSIQVKDMLPVIRNPSSHRFWATREKQVIGLPSFS
ncbi:SET domain-containing [Pyrrhoderma noxium]|uniref:SET domain-containing n=1 Tax=Pyrrhoderma noxium TaxID=2282107 RepID=A0A286UCN1_9AGAM|nr:SET domain-containing [Pyrrhoderma noxium]